ncbi:MAG: hypothetical protein BRC45_04880 [Cyanobacteria bacterium QS_5_48_63]|nr:MAG: hypothetical protein BRC45_04880 [Cyanobacteria bacterium QS_5_48_63]
MNFRQRSRGGPAAYRGLAVVDVATVGGGPGVAKIPIPALAGQQPGYQLRWLRLGIPWPRASWSWVLAIQLGKHQRHGTEETETVKGQKSSSEGVLKVARVKPVA